MPRFHFELHECGSLTEDDEGIELADLDAARERALIEARNVMSSEVLSGRLCFDCYILVQDARREVVFKMPFREALTVTGQSS